MSEDALKKLNDPQIIGLRCKGGAWPHALLSETPIPDAWMGLVVRPDGRRRFVPAGEDPRPEADDTLVLVRNRAITLPLQIEQAPTASEHAVDGVVEVLLRVAARDDELAAFHRGLLTESDLTLQRLADAVEQSGGSLAVRGFAAGQTAAKLVREDLRAALLAHLQAELRRFLFANGLVLERLGKVEFSSRTLNEQEALDREAARRVKELEARDLVERAALAATRRRLADLSEIFAKLRGAAEAGGHVQWHELLPTLTPGERGRLLENLWRVTPDQHVGQAVVLVTDQSCAWLDPAQPDGVVHQLDLPTELGGLRSAAYSPARGWLLIGAASGVWAVSVQDRQVVARFAVPDAGRPTTGFNSAAVAGERLVATHSQLGCWWWPLADPTAGEPLLRPIGGVPKTIRAATATPDGHVLFGADDEIHVFTSAGQRRCTLPIGRGSVHDIAVVDRTIYVTTSDGLVLEDLWDTANVWQVLHRRSEPIESIHARRWDDLVELVIPAGEEGVLGIYGDEGMVVQLMTAARPIRRAWACDDLIVGLNDMRDRLILLHGGTPGRTGREIPIARLLGRSIQDACIVTRHEGTQGRRHEEAQA